MAKLKTVIVVFKTHFDLGFTDLPDRVMAAYSGPMFAAVRAVMAATAREPPGARYTWTLPAWPLRYLLDSPAVPAADRAAAGALVRAGRLTWHAWPFTTHTAFCGLEELVRGLHVARDLGGRYGRQVAAAKQTDVPGHTWILPTLLARAGVRFLHLGCNSGSAPPQVPLLFYWEGPDGARVLTYYSPAGYGTPLLPPVGWPFDAWLALQQTVDNHEPHRPAELRAMRAEIAAGAPGARVLFGQLEDFLVALEANPAQLAQIPVISTDLADTWIHGVGTMPREVARVRALRGRLAATESRAALRPPSSEDVTRAAQIATAYENLLLFGEHTWGLDVKSTITRVFTPAAFVAARATAPYRRLAESWVAKAAYVDRAEAALAAAAGGHESPAPDRDGTVALFEPLGWARQGWVEAVWPDGAAPDAGPLEVVPTTGAPLMGEIRDGRLRFPGHTAPLSTALYRLRAHAGRPSVRSAAGPQPVLENAHFRLVVDAAAGGILSLVEKRSGHDWVGASAAGHFGAYRYDLFSASDIAAFLRAYGRLFQDWFVADFGKAGYPEDWPHLTSWAGGYRAVFEHGPGRQTLLLSDGHLAPTRHGLTVAPAQTIDLEISLYDDLAAIDLRYAVRGKAATPLSEAATVVFPLNLARPSFRLGQVGSVIDPARDLTPGANHSLWAVDNWVDASDDRQGLGIIPVDAPLVSLGSLGLYEYAPERVPATPLLFGHLFNTQWGTNFPQWLEGDFAFRYRLVPHAGDWRTGRLWQIAWETTRPCVAWPVEQHQGVAAEHTAGSVPGAGLVLGDGLVVLAVKPRPAGPGVLLRVWDALGLARTVPITLGRAVAEVWRCDLLERPGPTLPVTRAAGKATVALPIAPHAIETLVIAWGADETPGR